MEPKPFTTVNAPFSYQCQSCDIRLLRSWVPLPNREVWPSFPPFQAPSNSQWSCFLHVKLLLRMIIIN